VEAEHDAEFWSVIEESIAKSPESGEWRLAAAAWQLKHGNYEEAAVRLKAAEEALQPVFYRFLIEDAFFDFYRDRPEVRDLLGRKTKES
jgi:predicted Zn-dependent protease